MVTMTHLSFDGMPGHIVRVLQLAVGSPTIITIIILFHTCKLRQRREGSCPQPQASEEARTDLPKKAVERIENDGKEMLLSLEFAGHLPTLL